MRSDALPGASLLKIVKKALKHLAQSVDFGNEQVKGCGFAAIDIRLGKAKPNTGHAKNVGFHHRLKILFGAAGLCVKPSGNAAGKVCKAAGFTSQFHSLCHTNRVFCKGNSRIEQNAFTAKFHRNGHVRCRANPRINNNRHLRRFEDDSYVVFV